MYFGVRKEKEHHDVFWCPQGERFFSRERASLCILLKRKPTDMN